MHPAGNGGNHVALENIYLFLQADDLPFLLDPVYSQSGYLFGLLLFPKVSEISFAVWLSVFSAIGFVCGLRSLLITFILVACFAKH